MKITYLSVLESSVVAHAEFLLDMFKHDVSNSVNEYEENSRFDTSRSFMIVMYYVQLAYMNESGLSDNAIEKLIEIEKAANAIVQTWGDLKYKTKKIKRKVTIRNEKFHQSRFSYLNY